VAYLTEIWSSKNAEQTLYRFVNLLNGTALELVSETLQLVESACFGPRNDRTIAYAVVRLPASEGFNPRSDHVTFVNRRSVDETRFLRLVWFHPSTFILLTVPHCHPLLVKQVH
jgi:hypothetical protein